MKTLLLALLLPLTSTAASDSPPVQGYTATSFAGRDAATDTAAHGCQLDLVRVRSGDEVWVMLYAWANLGSGLAFSAAIPASLFPLAEGTRWKDWNGKDFVFENGSITGEGFTAKIDGKLLWPESVEATKADGSFLHCWF